MCLMVGVSHCGLLRSAALRDLRAIRISACQGGRYRIRRLTDSGTEAGWLSDRFLHARAGLPTRVLLWRAL